MKFLKDNKTPILIAGAIVLGLYAYFAFFRSAPSEDLLVSDSDQVSETSKELLATLANLKTIKLDDSIFSDPVFLSLTNFGVQLPPENVGRRNPFAPVGVK